MISTRYAKTARADHTASGRPSTFREATFGRWPNLRSVRLLSGGRTVNERQFGQAGQHRKSLAPGWFVRAIASVAVILGYSAWGQDWRFASDSSGNLVTQTAENLALPLIFGQPQTQVVGPGALASFFVVAADTRGLAYQWRFNGTNLGGGTGDALLLQNVGATNEGLYSVVLANSSGSITSAPAALMVDSDGDGLPDSWELAYFGNLNQYPTGDFDGDGVSNLDEFLEGTNPTNSASVNFRLTLVTDGGSVEVVPNRRSYTNGEVVTLTATAVAPNIFHTWTGDVNLTNNPLTLVKDTNKTVIANLASYDISWGNQSGEWLVYTNWIPNFVPGPNDNVFINGQSYTVNITGAAECRSLTLGGGATGSPTLTGSGELILHGNSSWLEGPMSGSGRTLVSPGVRLTVGSASQVNLTTRTLENAGTVVWAGTGGFIFSGAVITNRPGALFDLQSIATIIGGSPARFDNAGTFRKSVNSGTATFPPAVSFNNYSAVEIQTGILALAGGGTHTGSFDVPAGATLNLSGGIHTLSGGPSITGAGQLSVSGATATLAGLVNVSGTNLFAGGTANLNGNYICTNNTLVISGGTANFNGTVTVTPTVLNLSSGTANFNGTGTVTPALLNLSNGTLSGNQNVSVLDQMSWSGGTMSGAGRTILPTSATLNLANASAVTLAGGRILENNGTVLWTGANISLISSAVITNGTGALFETQGAGALSFGGGGDSRFDNAGTFRKSVNAGTTTVGNGVNFNNYGAVEIQTGILLCGSSLLNNGVVNLFAGATNRLANGGSGRGSFTAPATALVEWTGGTFTLNSGAQLNGGGLYRINGGTVNCNTDVVTENLDLLSAALGGTGMVTVNHLMNWTGGTISGVGRTIVSAGATLNLANASAVTLTGGRTLENNGTVLWTGANISLVSAVILTNRVGALFETQGAGSLSFGGGSGSRFDNAGTFRKSVNTGTNTVGNGVNFNNYGAVEIQTGILAANGGYTSTANALLNCAIGGTTVGTGYGQLQVAGTVTLNGALSVSLANGFLPTTNDAFTVLTAGARSTPFASFYYPSNLVTMQLSNTANSVIVGVSQVLVVPSPFLHLERTSPTAGRLYWSTNYPDFHLEYSASLGTSNWAAWGLPPVVQGADYVATNSLIALQKYYRLSRLPAPYTPPPPALKIERASTGAVRLLWLAEEERMFLLQSSTNLSSANWVPVSPPAALQGWNNIVTNALSGAQKFYRLAKP